MQPHYYADAPPLLRRPGAAADAVGRMMAWHFIIDSAETAVAARKALLDEPTHDRRCSWQWSPGRILLHFTPGIVTSSVTTARGMVCKQQNCHSVGCVIYRQRTCRTLPRLRELQRVACWISLRRCVANNSFIGTNYCRSSGQCFVCMLVGPLVMRCFTIRIRCHVSFLWQKGNWFDNRRFNSPKVVQFYILGT